MRIGRSENRKMPPARHSEAAILFAVGGHKFAIAATDVDEIRDLHGLEATPSAGATMKVRYTMQRNRRTCLVVDSSIHFHLLPSKATRILVLRKGAIALTADSIDRMAELTPMVALPQAFKGEERKWYRGLALIDDTVVPVVNPAEILSETEAAHARSAAQQQRKGAASA
jgi:chemotaxis signal transduction protein